MIETVFKKCLPHLMLYVSISTLFPYLLKYRLVQMTDVDSVQSPYLDNSTKIHHLFNLIRRNGDENGFPLLYTCLCESSKEYLGHDVIVKELRRYAVFSETVKSSALGQTCQYIVNSPMYIYDAKLDALIRAISDHIGQDWVVLAQSLGFTETDIQFIEYANEERDLKQQIYQFFHEWKQREGGKATRDKLYAAVRDGRLNELVEKLSKCSLIIIWSSMLV